MVSKLAQTVIDAHYVLCPFCQQKVELSEGVSVDAPGMPNLTFCSWKHLGRWIIETYEQGKQFGYGLEAIEEANNEH